MMVKSNLRIQRTALPTGNVRKSRVIAAAIKHSMPARNQTEDKPDAVKQLGTVLSTAALAASFMFGGMELHNIK